MNAFAAAGGNHDVVAGFAIWAAAILLYFVPSIVALIRRVPNAGSVIVINLLLGWLLGLGWIIALAMACRSKPQPPPPYAPPSWYPPQQQGPRP